MITFALALISLSVLFGSPAALAKRAIYPGSADHGLPYSNEHLLEIYFKELQNFKTDCGRYPTTQEGLAALRSKAPELACHKFQYPYIAGPCRVDLGACDVWRQPLKYESDGKTYKLEASHGYTQTEASPPHRDGYHWDNPNPPKDDPTEAPPGLKY